MGCYLDWENDIENKSHSKKKIAVRWHIMVDCFVERFIACFKHPAVFFLYFSKIAFLYARLSVTFYYFY